MALKTYRIKYFNFDLHHICPHNQLNTKHMQYNPSIKCAINLVIYKNQKKKEF